MSGWVPIYRSFFNRHDWLAPSKRNPADYGRAWLELIHMAQVGEYQHGSVRLREGEVLVAVRTFADRMGWSKSKAQRFLARLEESGMVGTVRGTPSGTVYRLENWDQFRPSREGRESSGTPAGTPSGTARPESEKQNAETRERFVSKRGTPSGTPSGTPDAPRSPASATAYGADQKQNGTLAGTPRGTRAGHERDKNKNREQRRTTSLSGARAISEFPDQPEPLPLIVQERAQGMDLDLELTWAAFCGHYADARFTSRELRGMWQKWVSNELLKLQSGRQRTPTKRAGGSIYD